jgi:muconolactone D-isomerase
LLYHVHMQVNLPADLDSQVKDDLIGREKAYSQDLQRSGKWPHIWRVVGEYANYSIVDVDSNDELHQMLSGLPLFPYMKIRVTPLATHPSDVKA